MKKEVVNIKLDEIVFDETIYPRSEHDPSLVQRYEESLESIEEKRNFISVSWPDKKILDGKHRWLAYKTRHNGDNPEIPVYAYHVDGEMHQFLLSAELNNSHGYQLNRADKIDCAKRMYGFGLKEDFIAEKLAVSKRAVAGWLARTKKEQKSKQKDAIRKMWMACYSQQEIASVINLTEEAIRKQVSQLLEDLPKVGKLHEHDQSFSPPIYNVWKTQNKTNKVNHFGNSESQWVDNLLYMYTEPLDIVIDPFAGGGSTIDVCKKRGRRYFVSDRKPIVSREHEIRKHDITEGLLKPPQWKDVKLVYLDPPYWKQAEGQYSEDDSDLANMSLEQFNTQLSGLIKEYSKKLSNAYIALIIQPTQWKAPERKFTDHVGDMLCAVNLPVEMRISAPYESQQCTAQMVEWAKENKTVLVLSREIIVWRID